MTCTLGICPFLDTFYGSLSHRLGVCRSRYSKNGGQMAVKRNEFVNGHPSRVNIIILFISHYRPAPEPCGLEKYSIFYSIWIQILAYCILRHLIRVRHNNNCRKAVMNISDDAFMLSNDDSHVEIQWGVT